MPRDVGGEPVESMTQAEWEKEQRFAAAMARTPASVATYGLIGLNALVYLAMVAGGVSPLEPTARQAFDWGADFGPADFAGQWWRLVTACFVHFGIIHIGMNMFILYQVGVFTEKLFGRWRYLGLYLSAGVLGNVVSVMAHPEAVGAGASGAVFGVYGGLLGFVLARPLRDTV